MLGGNAVWILPTILWPVRGAPVGLSVGDIIFLLTFTLALGFFVLFVFDVVPSVLTEWFGFYEWASRRRSEQIWKRIAALGDAQRSHFSSSSDANCHPPKRRGCAA